MSCMNEVCGPCDRCVHIGGGDTCKKHDYPLGQWWAIDPETDEDVHRVCPDLLKGKKRPFAKASNVSSGRGRKRGRSTTSSEEKKVDPRSTRHRTTCVCIDCGEDKIHSCHGRCNSCDKRWRARKAKGGIE